MTSKPAHHVPKDRQEATADEWGVGMLADGKVDVLTPEQYIRAKAERDAEEATPDEEMPEQEEDFADLLEE